MPSDLSEQERAALFCTCGDKRRPDGGHWSYCWTQDGVNERDKERLAPRVARIRDEAVKAAERALRERVEAVIEAKSFLGSFGESGPYIAVTDVRAALAAGSSPSEEACGSATCRTCGAANVTWATDNDLWRAVMTDAVAEWRDGAWMEPVDPGGAQCPTCFIRLAGERGVDAAWRVLPSWGPLPPMHFPAPSEKRCHCGDSLCTCAYPEPPRCDDENCHGECESPAPSEGDAEEREVDER